MKKHIISLLVLFLGVSITFSQNRDVTIKLYHTVDLHGNYFPFDFLKNQPCKGGFSRVSAFIKDQRAKYGNDHVLLLDGGDLLQGQPSAYFFNYVDVSSPHLCADIMNYIGYDATVLGNHDIETGASVFTRLIEDCKFPTLGANIFSLDGYSYLPPYAAFEKDGVKIVVVGVITQAIPAWLPRDLWSGLYFADIEETIRMLLPVIKAKEKPDIFVGVFHSGIKESVVAGYRDGVVLDVAKWIPEFDVIFCGHDHLTYSQKIVNIAGDSTLVLNPASGGNLISDATVKLNIQNGKVVKKTVSGGLTDISTIEPDRDYMKRFAWAYREVDDYVNSKVGTFAKTISVRDAFFGPSAFVDLLHSLQLKFTGAEISLVSPSSLDAVIDSGKIYMRDLFNLYRYENLLYTMELTGKEIHDALEYSAGLWCRQMTSANDQMLLIEFNTNTQCYRFINPYYSFDSAAGILYTIDLSRPVGDRVFITSMADGTPFYDNKLYRVAVSSYRASGAGSILTKGAGIPQAQLNDRVVSSTDKDMRYYLAEEIKKQKIVSPKPLNQWRFIPEKWVKEAAKRDYELMFGKK